jgi:TPR repeat protein
MGVLADLNEAPRWLKILGAIFAVAASLATAAGGLYGWVQLNTAQRNEILSYLPERFRPVFSKASDRDELGVRANCLRLSAQLLNGQFRLNKPTPEFKKIDAEPIIAACQIASTSFPRDTQLKFELANALLFKGDDDDRAIALLKQAAESGSLSAMSLMGDCYLTGVAVTQNRDEAYRWFKMAADEGSADAMAKVGNSYLYGYGVAKNVADGNKWLQTAADRGSTSALIELGDSYRFGRGVTKDEERAAKLYEKAADAGDELAMQYLSAMNERGINGKVDKAAAIRWLRSSASAGSLVAMNNLGNYYNMGYLVKQDKAEALFWIRKSAELGYPIGMYSLSLLLREEKKKEAEANSWLIRAADAGQPDAEFSLSVAYLTGRAGVAQDPNEAFRWLKKAAADGLPSAMDTLGVSIQRGIAGVPNQSEAISWFRRAAQNQYAPAMYNLSKALREQRGDDPEANTWLRAASDAGFPEASFDLSSALREGKWGIKSDVSEGVKLLRFAAENSEPRAMAEMSVLYSVGGYVQKDGALALAWRKRALATGDTEAIAILERYDQSISKSKR